MNGHDETAAASSSGSSHIPAVSSLQYMLQGAEHSSSVMGGSTVAVAAAAPPAPSEEPPIKKLKLGSHTTPEDLRRRILDYKLLRLKTLRDRFTEQLSELYFLQAGGNMMDYAAWRRRPVAPQLQAFVDARRPAPVSAEPTQITTVVAPTGGSGVQDEAAATARQEARVCARVAELARQGLWTERRLPRVCEPPRNKTHWDYLLEEMAWLSHDFAHERKWKKHAAKKCARAVQKYFQDKAQAAQKAEKAQELQLRKVAAFAAKEIRIFWTNVEKLVEWKREQRLERERKMALDEQLSYIVDRTEQYSRQLAANLTTDLPPGCPPSPARSDYSGAEDDADDETTIAAQERAEKPEDTAAEIEALQAEADLDIEELRKRYANPPPTTPSSLHDTDDDETTDIDSDDETDAESDASDDASERLEALVEDLNKATTGTSNEDVEAASSLAASLQPTGTTLSSTAVATPVPKLLKHSLREYQHVGLHWLATMHQRSLNGILADEMGLGKTIQTIALLAHLAERGDWGPHLVVAPTSVVMNWEFEFKKWCPAFKILTYYGSIKERKLKRVGWTKYNSFHICITSYKLVVQDHQSFRRKRWHYLILDEAQNIKNFKSQRWQMLLNFQTERRLLLTGTPLQNSLLELWSLMHFLMPHVFASHSEFREWFGDVAGMAEGAPRHDPLLRRLHQVLRPFLLRRLKRDVERQLPRKYEHVLMCRLARRQRALYDDFMSRARTKDALASGNLLSVINVLMQLRKVCNHPDLFEPRPVSSPLSMEQLIMHLPALVLEFSAETAEHVQRIARLAGDLATFEAEGVGAFEAHRARHLAPPRRLVEELTETPAQPRPPPCALRLHLRLVARSPPALHRAPPNPPSVAFSAASTAPKAASAAVTVPTATTGARARLEARRKANLRRLATVNERRCWRLPLYGADLRAAVNAPPPAPPLEFAPKDLEAFVESMHDVITRFTVIATSARAPSVRVWYGAGAADWRRRVEHIEGAVEESTKQALAALHTTVARQSVAFPHPSLLQYDCGKLQRLATLLRQLKAGSHRVLIFTQMTRVLDVLESFLSRLGHTYLRLDGATRVDARQTIVERFNGDKRVFCMVLSTRSGGVGLNLTGADTVVFYDSDWNPTMDAQAQDRAHRIGQTRDVHVYRLVTAASVEENILRKAHQKRALSHLAIEDGHFTTSYLAKVNISDLFGSDVAETSETGNSGETLENALAAVEEEADSAAARAATIEARAQLAEFDENVPLPMDTDADNAQAETDPPELAALLQQLSPIEKYAMRMVECSEAATEADRAARDTVQRQRAEWEQARKRLQDEPAPATPTTEQDDLTYCREDASAQIWISGGGAGTKMPMWCPPTPPSSEGDVYCETWSRSLYRSGAAADCLLPAVARRDPRRARLARPAHAPPSIFERGGSRPRPRPRPPPVHPHQRDPPPLEWSPAEDAALRRALRLQRLPAEPPPALAPNWEWVSELVNEVARAYRSARSCRDRHDILADPERARRKHKRPPAARRRLDEDAPRPPLAKLDAMRDAAERRRSAPKRRTDDPQQHNPKHVALLSDHGVDYESPPTPMEVAMRRADRIAKEKQKAGGTTAAAPTQPQTQAVVGTASTAQVQAVATQRVVVAGTAKPTDARGRVRAGVPQPQLVYRQQPIGARHHLKLLHHPATPGQIQTPTSGSGEVRTLQLHHVALRRATPAAGTAGTPHVVVAHLAPPPPPADQTPASQPDPRRQ